MKYFVVFALCVAAASAFVIPPVVSGMESAELQQIIEAMYHPSTDPATAAALEQMLMEVLGMNKPVIVEDNDFVPIDIGPAIIDESIVSQPANYPSPLVQIIINVNTNAPGNAVVIEQPEQPGAEGVVVIEKPEVPEEIIVAPVIVPENPVEVPTPVIVNPIETIPAINLPGILTH